MSRILRQPLIILAIAGAIYFSVDFGKRVELLAQLSQREARREQEVKIAETRQTELRDQLAQVFQPAFAERIAREIYHWSREGETVVVTQKISAPIVAPPPAPAPPPPAKEWWQTFLDFLFGSP